MCKKSILLLLILLAAPSAFSQPLDKNKYITIDEVRPGMQAWCLTVFEGVKIEKFGLEVVSVVKNFEPGRNIIIVKGTDPRFVHTGPVAGCSGSPVYIDGRMAGALASGWPFSKDPLYGVTPIEEMLNTGENQRTYGSKSIEVSNLAAWNFTRPLDLIAAADKFSRLDPAAQPMPTGAAALPVALSVSQLPSQMTGQLNAFCSSLGFVAASGMGGSNADANLARDTKLEPGATAVVPLVDGDMKIAAVGTVTEVVGDKVYAFGHSFLGNGQTDLPLATGQVSVVVANLMRSFKVGSTLEVKGAITCDESAAVVGTIGKKARMIPLTVKIDRYNDSGVKIYNCQMVSHELLSPLMVMMTVSAATMMRGPLPPEHSVSYNTVISLDGLEPIVFDNISSSDDAMSMIKECVSTVGLLLNNPYKKVKINSIECRARILPKNIMSRIWSLTLSDAVVKAGQTIDVSAVVEPYLAAKKTYDLSVHIPDELKPGEYELTVMGAAGYEQFLRKIAPERFRTDNLPNLLAAMRNLADIRRDRLYAVLVLPASGVAVENAVLSDLPPSKALVLQDDKRTLTLRPYQSWIEKNIQTDSIVTDSKTIRIKVEQ